MAFQLKRTGHRCMSTLHSVAYSIFRCSLRFHLAGQAGYTRGNPHRRSVVPMVNGHSARVAIIDRVQHSIRISVLRTVQFNVMTSTEARVIPSLGYPYPIHQLFHPFPPHRNITCQISCRHVPSVDLNAYPKSSMLQWFAP